MYPNVRMNQLNYVHASTHQPVVAFFLGTHGDWGGASRALLNFVRKLDRRAFCPLVVIPRRGPVEETLAEHDIPCEVWPGYDRTPNLLRYGIHIIKAMDFLRKRNIAIMHLNYCALGWKPAEIIAARLLRIPMVTHLHLPTTPTSSYLKYSSALVGVSRYVCENVDRHDVACHAIHNVSDVNRFANGVRKRGELGLREDSVVVGICGQVRRIKGISMFLDLAKRISDKNVEFVIAGELRGDDTYSPDEFARMIGEDQRITFLGRREDIEDVYATCDIVVMPSQWGEPCAMVLFEASTAAKPIVATATGGTPEILIDGETGYLVARDDIDSLVDRVGHLIRDTQLRQSLGKQAKERAVRDFAERPVRMLEALYQRLLDRKGYTPIQAGADRG
jgi:L-malate glycosyltransferase